MQYIIIAAVFLLEKGPSESAKVLFVKSADETSRMKWLGKIFLSEEEVEELFLRRD